MNRIKSGFIVIAAAVVVTVVSLVIGTVGGYIALRQLHAILVQGDPVTWGRSFAFSIGIACIISANKTSKKS